MSVKSNPSQRVSARRETRASDLRFRSEAPDISRPPPPTPTYVARIIVKDEGNRVTKRPQSHVRLSLFLRLLTEIC